MDFKPDITLTQRYECKYVVSPLIVPDMREFLRPFATPDPYAAVAPGHRYAICSLYLDTADLELYRQTVGGDKNRFKLRIRTYSDDPKTPVFCEVKSKIDSIVSKRRARVDRATAVALARGKSVDASSGLDPETLSGVEYFAHHCRMTSARPVVRVGYMREAYQASTGEPVRVTIDTDLRHALTFGEDLSIDNARWVTTPIEGSILELKFTDRFPPWIQDMVRRFGLKQRPVPKYVLSLDHALMEGREAAVSFAGLTLPPRRN